MPTYDDRKKSINYYGVFALWSSILLIASYFSLLTSGCDDNNITNRNNRNNNHNNNHNNNNFINNNDDSSFDFFDKLKLQKLDITITLIIGFLFGILLFLFSLCHIAQKLYYSKFIFYLIVVMIVTISIILLFTSYQTIQSKCTIGRYYERNSLLVINDNNFTQTINNRNKEDFERTLKQINKNRNQHYLVAAILDVISSLLFAASAYAFRNRF